jgi:HAD superfamily hydrolase (TIGR01509 family)
MQGLRAVLLDIDGTLIDSNDRHADCWVEAFAHFGVKTEWDAVRMQIGKGGDLLVPDTLNARQVREFGKELRDYRGELWKRRYMESVQPFPGAREAIAAFREHGLRVALASSANPDEVEYYVELLGARELVETTTSTGDAEVSKPAPDIFEAALQRLHCDPGDALVAGDTPYDILAGHRAGIAVVALLSGGFPRETLLRAEYLFDHIGTLVKELDRIDDDFRR